MELELRIKEAQLREAALAAKVGTCICDLSRENVH